MSLKAAEGFGQMIALHADLHSETVLDWHLGLALDCGEAPLGARGNQLESEVDAH